MEFYNLSVDECLKNLNSRKSGLRNEEVEERASKYGLNEIKGKKVSVFSILLRQFTDIVIYILLIASLISFLIGEILDGFAILSILVVNGALGFFQEFKAEKSIELLRELSVSKVTVLRNNNIEKIDSKYIIPGDILILESGDKIGADARIIESSELQTQEAVLTGESTPVSKNIKTLDGKVEVGDRINIVFSGTVITSGRGKAVVTNIGMDTEFGKIAKLVSGIKEEETPLHKKLKELSRTIGIGALVFVVIVFLIGILKNFSVIEMVLVALTLAVAVVPEGLPVVMTVALAIGVQRMVKKNALIKRLRAVETLGSITVACVDKTGTLTRNEMVVSELFVNNDVIKVTGKGYEVEGDFYIGKNKADIRKLKLLLEIGASCNNSDLDNLIGDPTELALVVVARKAGVKGIKERVSEVPFSSERKYMETNHLISGKKISYIKGATEKVLDMCNYVSIEGRPSLLTTPYRNKILLENKRMASNALRVLAMAYRESNKVIFVGLVGMIDLPRAGIEDSIKIANKAGIRVVMLTGDHRLTAEAIAKMIGIKGSVYEGKDIDEMDEKDLKEIVKKAGVFARVNPEHKVRLLEAYQNNNEVVAMTGDGVNDAPALKKADVGVAMRIKGTDVSRDAADMVLVDDNFSSIVKAVEEGRIIYDNIKKFIRYLLSANIGEIASVLFIIIAGLPLPLLPLQILWLNLVTDSLPALALGVEIPEKGVMNRKPRDPKESLFKGLWGFLIFAGVLGTIATIIGFLFTLSNYNDVERARTVALTTLLMFELFLVVAVRSERKLTEIGFFSNKYLIWAVLAGFFAHLILLYTPLNKIFEVVALGFSDWILVVILGSIGLLFFEVKKYLRKENVTN